MQFAELDHAVEVFLDPARHHELAGQTLALPAWFDTTLDADSPRFREQQMQLWREITLRTDYDPLRDEDTPEIPELDAIYRPAFYATGDAHEAGLHLLAMGHILLRSGVREGDRVLECGAGFGQNALAFARLGIKVDTIDIGRGFCGAVAKTAAHFNVDLTPHNVAFGTNPAGAPQAYDLILFYESFHHCLDFKEVIPKLRDMLKPDGRILLAGEPITAGAEPLMPYPWGIRLDWTNVAVMRQRGWMELGFQLPYLVRQFANAGLTWHLYPDANAHTANVHEFRPWRDPIALSSCSLTAVEEASWHGAEPAGRWTRARSLLTIPSRTGSIAVEVSNPHPVPRTVQLSLASEAVTVALAAGERQRVLLSQDAAVPDQQLAIASSVEPGSPIDPRQLGIFVERVSPC